MLSAVPLCLCPPHPPYLMIECVRPPLHSVRPPVMLQTPPYLYLYAVGVYRPKFGVQCIHHSGCHCEVVVMRSIMSIAASVAVVQQW